MALSPQVEAQALQETEDAVRELMKVGHNIGCHKASLAMMLRTIAEEMAPSIVVHPAPPMSQ